MRHPSWMVHVDLLEATWSHGKNDRSCFQPHVFWVYDLWGVFFAWFSTIKLAFVWGWNLAYFFMSFQSKSKFRNESLPGSTTAISRKETKRVPRRFWNAQERGSRQMLGVFWDRLPLLKIVNVTHPISKGDSQFRRFVDFWLGFQAIKRETNFRKSTRSKVNLDPGLKISSRLNFSFPKRDPFEWNLRAKITQCFFEVTAVLLLAETPAVDNAGFRLWMRDFHTHKFLQARAAQCFFAVMAVL